MPHVHSNAETLPLADGVRRFRAPGRVNLVGEHTDYADGFCMPAALQFGTTVSVSPLPSRELRLASRNAEGVRVFALDELPAVAAGDWSDYIVGVAKQLQARGVALPGVALTVDGDVPRNAGLSSSASLEVAAAMALLAAADASLPPREIAQLCQAAENDFVGAPCGIMDQFISVHGRAGHALQLDCRDLSCSYVPLPDTVRLVIVNSMVKHSVGGGEYGERRAQVEQGTAVMRDMFPQAGIRALRDVSIGQLGQAREHMPEVVYRRCRHVITDSGRVLQGGDMLRSGELEAFGKLMTAAHASYRDDFEASCAECDLLVNLAMQQQGCLGARLTGGGFGGCVVSLVRTENAEAFLSSMLSAYQREIGIAAEGWVGIASDGASEFH